MLISVAGKKHSGKTTVAKIWQMLANNYSDEDIERYITNNLPVANGGWHIKHWADNLKRILLLSWGYDSYDIDTKLALFDSPEFKERELPEEWWFYEVYQTRYDYLSYKDQLIDPKHLVKPTVRWFLQQVGTEALRGVHPNFHVNTIVNNYKTRKLAHFIVPDTRFPNEFNAATKLNGITIYVGRNVELRQPKLWKQFYESVFDEWDEFLKHVDKYDEIYHESETALNSYYHQHDFIITNNGTLLEFIAEVRKVYNQVINGKPK